MDKYDDILSALVSIYDSLSIVDRQIIDKDIRIHHLEINEETLTVMFFRKLKAYGIDLNKELEWDHLKPVINKRIERNSKINDLLDE